MLQINVGRGRTATDEVLDTATCRGIPILLIQEPYKYKNMATGLGKYSNQVITGNKLDEPPWACIVLTQREYTGMLLKDVSTAHCVCAYISGPYGSFYAISAYFQYSLDVESSLQELHKILQKIGSRRQYL